MEPTQNIEQKSDGRSRSLRSFSAGAAGALVVAVAIAGLGLVGAGAQEPTPVADETGVATAASGSFTSADAGTLGGLPIEDLPFDPALDDRPFDPALEAEWAEYDACMNEQLGDADPFGPDMFDPESVDPAVLDEFDAKFAAADEACGQFLPAEVQAEMAAWAEYDVCVEQSGAFAGPDFGGFSVISVDSPDRFQTIDLGSGPATVTITSDGSSVAVSSTGDATVMDEAALDAQWAEFDRAIAACEPLLPADAQG